MKKIILFVFVLFTVNVIGQISSDIIGNGFNDVKEILNKNKFLDSTEIIYYGDSSIAIYANFNINGTEEKAVYSFDGSKKCIFYFVATKRYEVNRITDILNRNCTFSPKQPYPMRWVDDTSPAQSIWKLHMDNMRKHLYIFVMDIRYEDAITNFLENKLILR